MMMDSVSKHNFIYDFSYILSTYTTSINKLVKMLVAVLIGLAPYLDKFLMTLKFCGTLNEKPDAQLVP